MGRPPAPRTDAAVYEANYVGLSQYWLQADQWLQCFPREQLLILRSADLRMLEHIGLEPGWRPEGLDVRHNPREAKTLMPGRDRRVAAALRELGRERPARALGPLGRLGRLARPIDGRATLSPDVYDALCNCVRADLARRRPLVGDDMDLGGLA